MKIRLAVITVAVLLLVCSLSSCGTSDNKSKVHSVANADNVYSTKILDENNSADSDNNGKTTKKNAQDSQKDIVPIDSFSTIRVMQKKANTYSNVDSIYYSAGFDISTDYYCNFTEDKLTMIFKDKFVTLPEFMSDAVLDTGGLYAFGYYFFSVSYQNNNIELQEYTYKNPDKIDIAKMDKTFSLNDKTQVYKSDGKYYFEQNGYLWSVKSDNASDSALQTFIKGIKFTKFKIA